MKKIVFVLLFAMCSVFIASAQTKTAYCDVYARGGGQKMKVTVLYGKKPFFMGKKTNLGVVLDTLCNDGWTVDESLVIPRNGSLVFWTRHKIHLIMKKEYNEGENPYAKFEKVKKGKNKKAVTTKKK